jgi:hypothetical protein
MSKQTAFKWSLEQWPILESQLPPSIINETLQLEREQIEEAFNVYGTYAEAAEYFNEIYGGNNE